MGQGPDRISFSPEQDADDQVAGERERMLALAHRKRHVPRYRSLVLHWLGRSFRRPRPAEVTPLPAVEPGQVGISFAGHATVLVRYANLTIACDPMLGRWVKGVKRAVQPGLSPADLHEVDLILISHAHADHLHRKTLAALPRSATIVVPPRTAQHVSDLGFARVVELEVGQSIQHRNVDVVTAPVRHGDPDDIRALSYVIRGDGPSVYFCGDSGYFSGFAEIGKRLRPDIALLPVGGYAPLSFRERHMSPLDALYALEDLGARIMIPVHHGAFALSYEQLQEPSRWLAELVRERDLADFVVELRPGESRVFVPPRSQRSPAEPGTPFRTGLGSENDSSAPTPDSQLDALPAPERPRNQAMRPPAARDMHPLPVMRAYMRMRGMAAALARPRDAAPALAAAVGADDDLVIDVIWDEAAVPG